MNDQDKITYQAEIDRLNGTIKWYQGQAGQRIGEAARAGMAGAPASPTVDRYAVPIGYVSAYQIASMRKMTPDGSGFVMTMVRREANGVHVIPIYDVQPAPIAAGPVAQQAAQGAMPQSMLREPISATNPLPPGCYCKPGQCGAPRPNWCRDAAKRDATPAEQSTDKTAEKKPLKHCAANRDGDCTHHECPQLRYNEPHASGRHCPIDASDEAE